MSSLELLTTKLLAALLSAIFLLSSPLPSAAQSRQTGLDCVRHYFNIKEDAPEDADYAEMSFSPSLANQLLSDIRTRLVYNAVLKAVECDRVANAIPFLPKVSDFLPHPLNTFNFIIYNNVWVTHTLGENRTQAIFLLGHEIGHITRGHLGERKGIPRLTQETEADYEGACTVARLGGNWDELVDYIKRIRGPVVEFYPRPVVSLRQAADAFRQCGGIESKTSQGQPTTVVYFYKRADRGRVVNALSSLGLRASVRQSGVYKGVDYSDRETDTLTCHRGVSPQEIRRVALALVDSGVQLRAISEPDPENQKFTRRLTLEAAAKSRSVLTRQTIEQIADCPGRFDPTYGKGR